MFTILRKHSNGNDHIISFRHGFLRRNDHIIAFRIPPRIFARYAKGKFFLGIVWWDYPYSIPPRSGGKILSVTLFRRVAADKFYQWGDVTDHLKNFKKFSPPRSGGKNFQSFLSLHFDKKKISAAERRRKFNKKKFPPRSGGENFKALCLCFSREARENNLSTF